MLHERLLRAPLRSSEWFAVYVCIEGPWLFAPGHIAMYKKNEYVRISERPV